MAILFPIKIDGKKLYVNPTKMTVRKRAQISEVRTMSGTTFQVWPDMPDEIDLEGIFFGARSFFELRDLQDTLSNKTPDRKQIDLTYKWKKYPGFIKEFEISSDADKPRQFAYKLTFISRVPFDLPQLILGQMTGIKAEMSFLENQTRGAVFAGTEAFQSLMALPDDIVSGVLQVGSSLGDINLNIGRSKGIA
jgi:hypothetical protein